MVPISKFHSIEAKRTEFNLIVKRLDKSEQINTKYFHEQSEMMVLVPKPNFIEAKQTELVFSVKRVKRNEVN